MSFFEKFLSRVTDEIKKFSKIYISVNDHGLHNNKVKKFTGTKVSPTDLTAYLKCLVQYLYTNVEKTFKGHGIY